MATGNEIGAIGGQHFATQSSSEAYIGLLGDFCGGFENSLKSQANGAIQLANKLGAKIDETQLVPVDNASFGSKEWAAQIAGQAAALSVELFAARKLGVSLQGTGREGGIAATAKVTENGSTKIASSITLGATLGGVLTPTNDSGNFWSERLRNAVSGAVSFGAMGGVSVGLEEASKLGSGALSTAMRNGYVNNAIGGFVGGSVGDMTRSGLSNEMPNVSKHYWQHVAQSGVEFSIVGVGAHSLGRAAEGISALGEQKPGTDRTNAKYLTDSIGLTRNPQTYNTQAEYKVISGKAELDRLNHEVRTGVEKSQADVLVKQQLHGLLGDFFGPKFRPLGDPKLMLLSHGTNITPEAAAKYDLIGTCSPLEAQLQSKDVFRNRADSENTGNAVWLNNRTDSTFSLTRNRLDTVPGSINFEPVMLGSVGRGAVEVQGQPVRAGESWIVNDQLEVGRSLDGRLYARGRSRSDGVWEKIQSGVDIVVNENDRLYHGQKEVASSYLKSATFIRPGQEITNNGHTVGKNAKDQLYVRDNNSPDGIFIRRVPGLRVEMKTADQYVHLGPFGKVDLKFAPVLELAAKDSVLVNGKTLQSGAELTFGRASDRNVQYPDADLSVSRVHGTVSRDSSGQIYVTDASSFGTYLKLPKQIRVPLDPTDTVGILTPGGKMELHSIVNLSIKSNAERLLQPAQPNLKIEPVFVGRTGAGTVYLQDNSAASDAWLKLRKSEPTPVQANDELILGTQGSRLKLEVAPPPVIARPATPPVIAPPVAPLTPPPVVRPVNPLTPPPVVRPVNPLTPPPVVQRPVTPFTPPRPGTPPPGNLPPDRIYKQSQLSGITYGYKVRTPFSSTDPVEIQKHNDKIESDALKPIHSGQWGDVSRNGALIDTGAMSYLAFDNIRDAKATASFIEGIINRKTKGIADAGYGAKLVGKKYTPMVYWNGIEGMVDIDRLTGLPRAIVGAHGTKKIPN